jgi:hypothetical protein
LPPPPPFALPKDERELPESGRSRIGEADGEGIGDEEEEEGMAAPLFLRLSNNDDDDDDDDDDDMAESEAAPRPGEEAGEEVGVVLVESVVVSVVGGGLGLGAWRPMSRRRRGRGERAPSESGGLLGMEASSCRLAYSWYCRSVPWKRGVYVGVCVCGLVDTCRW